MIYTMICPKCEKSREFYEVKECDPVTKKHWTITRCRKCAYNADIIEGTYEISPTKVKADPDGGSGKTLTKWVPGM